MRRHLQRTVLVHVPTEAQALAAGLGELWAHRIAMQSHPPYLNYDPEVIVEFLTTAFNSNWLKAWGIGE